MPGKKKKYNSRFPPARIKRIMQTDEDIGKVAAAVPVIISRTLEMFIQSILRPAANITIANNVRTLTTSHIKQSIASQPRFGFLMEHCKKYPESCNDQVPEGFQLPSDSIVKKEIKQETTDASCKERQGMFKRSVSDPTPNIPKRKRGRPRKVKSFVDEDNNENGVSNCTVSNNFKEMDIKALRESEVPERKFNFSTSVPNSALSDAQECKEEANFLENIKISIPGFGSSSLTVAGPVLPIPPSSPVVALGAPAMPSMNAEVDEDYN